MFTAIVLDDASVAVLKARASYSFIPYGWKEHCHHITLAMGDAGDRFAIGERRAAFVTGAGMIDGRVSAFRVALVSDKSDNATPHVTIATAPDAKPKESKEIRDWFEIEPFAISGTIQICG